jgi:hypothetical protein
MAYESSAGTKPVVAHTGDQVGAEVMRTLLRARGVDSKVTRDHESEGGPTTIEAVIIVPPRQVEEARALFPYTQSGAAKRAQW